MIKHNPSETDFLFSWTDGPCRSMGKLKIRSKLLERECQKRTKELLDCVRGLPDRPSPDAIHDLRVAARRAQVLHRFLPRRTRRTGDSGKFDLALKSVLRATSHLRDLDTLKSTLELHRASLPSELLLSLDNDRSDAAAAARATVGKLSSELALGVDTSGLGGRDLTKKLRRRVKRRGRRVTKLLTAVISDEGKVEELHTLRKEVKKLRYLLELAEKIPPESAVLTKWQESLGAIHDLDVAMGYLQESRLEFPREMTLRELRRSRHSSYVKFVMECKAKHLQALRTSAILAPGPLPEL